MPEPSLRSYLAVDLDTRFPLEGGGRVEVGRGVSLCQVDYSLVEDRRADWDFVRCRLRLCAQGGQLLALTREVSAHTFFNLIRLGCQAAGVYRPILRNLQCHLDTREAIPAV